MLKTIGAILIVFSSGFYGLSKSQQLKKRCVFLDKLIEAMLYIEQEISYGKNAISDVLKSVGKTKNIDFFIEIADMLTSKSPKSAFLGILSKHNTSLLGTDNDILVGFFESLGTMDTISQLKCISHTKELLELAKDEANSNYKKFGKLYSQSGFLCGLLILMILL